MAGEGEETTTAAGREEEKKGTVVTDPPKDTPPEPAKETPPAKPAEPAKETPPAKPAPPKEYKLNLPKDSNLGEEDVERTVSYAKEQGLSHEEAQRVLDRESQAVADYIAGIEAQSDMWLEETKADKDIGGDHFAENAELAKRVVDKFGSDELKQTLISSGLGNHKEVVRIFSEIGKAMKDDTFVKGATGKSGEKTAADIMYPESTNKPGGKD